MSKRPRLATAIRLTITAFRRDDGARFGAALAFYIVFSLAPMLLFAIAIARHLLGRGDYAQQEILDRIGVSIGSAASIAIAEMLRDSAPHVGWLPTILGLSTLYFGLSGVYRQIDDALRRIWREEPAEDVGIIRRVEKKLMSMLLVASVGGIVLLSIVADAAIAIMARYAASRLVGGAALWQVLQLLISTLVLGVLFAAVFRHLPQVRQTWSDVRLGAALTAALFVIGKFALGIYLLKAAIGSAYGAAGSIIVVLLWSYWSAQIFFIGLEFTHVYAQERVP